MKWSRGIATVQRQLLRLRSLLMPTTVGAKTVALGAVVVLLAGGAFAAQTALASGRPPGPAAITVSSPRPAVAAHPQLTTNTPAGCNTPQPKGHARCFAIVRTPSDHTITADSSGPPSTALGPADIQSAYNLPSATAGGGQTVALVDAFDDPAAESDLAAFRSQYGLPACTTANGCFRKVNQQGQASPLPANSGGPDGWAVEISLDLDAVSSACPNCNILLVEADSNANANLEAAVNEAVTLGAKFVSNSYGGPETASETTTGDPAYDHPGVAITASAGDGGYGVNYPSASQYVTAVGGTTLTKDTNVARGWDESVWDHSGNGTGSGCSAYEPQPSFQQGITQLTAVCQNRATADVSADADPASGLAIYDTDGEGGWLQVGGTSLASPLIAATYALAGAPAAGTYPNAYPYHDTSQSADLNDITSGSNGTCGNVLCNGGTGWDGPTGLGTPDGIKAFQGAPQGQISGQLTDSSTGKPITGATVTAQPGDYVAHTDSNGNYNLTLAGGTYTLTAADYGYQTATQSGVQVTANQTLTANFTLTAEPSGTLSGTVTDGSGQGWPLHAQITIPGYPSGSVWTSPYTGAYSVTLPQGSYTLTVSTDYPGYQDKTVQVSVGAGTTTQNVTLDADLTACTAPGYGPSGLTESFTGWTGGTARDGWSVASHGPRGADWMFDNPGQRPAPPGGDNQFAVADDGSTGSPMDTTLTSPPVNLSGQTAPSIQFDSAYYTATSGQSAASVWLSVDGGRSWANVWQQSASNAIGQVTIPIPQAAGKTGVEARFGYTARAGWYWAIDNILIGTSGCVPKAGGMVAGVVSDTATHDPVNGATITSASAQPQPWPAGISLANADPALPGGFYWLFTPAGAQQLSAAAAGYATATASVTVTAGQVTQHGWALTPSGGG